MVKTQNSHSIELLARLIASDASFLTLREKLIFYKFLLADENGKPFEDENTFTEGLLLLTLTKIEILVKRTFPRARWNSSEALRKVKIAARIMEFQKIKSTSCMDSDFPAMLREMKDPPFMLFYRGNLEVLNRRCVSVVGTRHAFAQSLSAASEFSRKACDDGLCVVSGLAFGIDAASHKGALLSKNPATCAVLPCGIDIIRPYSNTRLAAKILESGGLLVSEYLPGTPSVPFRYVQRNRIVAALSPATLVVQASAGSGAMITADLALGYNREVFFHIQCFSQKILEINLNSEYKKSSTPKSFVDDGAAVISDYEHFKEVLNYGEG
ncbi:MAG: DNA-processing protein DprA [Treponema sp.]|nr:DNA-processing protein DprA [Treponema sp.]